MMLNQAVDLGSARAADESDVRRPPPAAATAKVPGPKRSKPDYGTEAPTAEAPGAGCLQGAQIGPGLLLVSPWYIL